MLSNRKKKVCASLNCIERLLILAFTITGCISISAFTSLISIPIGVTSSTIELKIYAITLGIKKYKSIIKKKKHDRIILLGKPKLNTIDVLISTPSIDSVISNYEFDLIDNLQIEYDKMKKQIKNLKTLIIVYQRF